MSIFEAIFLGVIQGLTEFFPISSSGHLKLAQFLFGLEQLSQYILFDLVCHLGTLFAIFLGFWKDIIHIIKFDRGKIFLIAVATLPLLPMYPFFGFIKYVFNLTDYLFFFFLITAFLLFLGEKASAAKKRIFIHNSGIWLDAFIIGIFQVFALFPGISRSASTISAASFLGWNKRDSVRFSFLMAIPSILGGAFLEFLSVLKNTESLCERISFSRYLIGFTFSFIIGRAALSGVSYLAESNRLKPFVWYCCILSAICFFTFNFFTPM